MSIFLPSQIFINPDPCVCPHKIFCLLFNCSFNSVISVVSFDSILWGSSLLVEVISCEVANLKISSSFFKDVCCNFLLFVVAVSRCISYNFKLNVVAHYLRFWFLLLFFLDIRFVGLLSDSFLQRFHHLFKHLVLLNHLFKTLHYGTMILVHLLKYSNLVFKILVVVF